jgi:hypothetical protein
MVPHDVLISHTSEAKTVPDTISATRKPGSPLNPVASSPVSASLAD